jgi:hypothetical protein
MKTPNNTRTLLLFCSLFFTTLLAVANTTPTTSVSSSTEKTIRQYFKFPQVLLPLQHNDAMSNKVEVVFTTDSFGKVNFALAKTQNRILKQEIEKQFLALQLPKLKHEVAHSVVLNFKVN